ncbi:MAG: MFS transporter [Acidobacteriaceae bacterium]|nr:MFS transporter [Acidobacteriaceae bacterium]
MDTHEALSLRHSLQREAECPGAKRGLVLLTACSGVFVGFGSAFVFTFSVFLKPLSLAFGWTRAQVSLGFTVAAITVALCSPLIGRLLDRYPPQRIVVPCVAIYGLGFASLALLTRHFAQFLAVLFLIGIVANGTTQLGYARVVSAWFDQSRGRALAAVMAGSGAGSMIFPPVAQMLIASYGWRFAYAALGGTVLVLGVPFAVLFLREPPGHIWRRTGGSSLRANSGTAAFLFSRAFLLLVSALLLFSLATNGLTAHLAPLLTDRGISPAHSAAVLSVLGFAVLASKLSTGYLLDRFFAGRVAAVLLLICTGGFLCVIFARSIATAILGALLVGAGMGSESDVTPYFLTRFFGLHSFSELYGYTWSVYACAAALGPLLMGGVFDRGGSYRAALIVFCAFVFISACLFALLPKYPRNTPVEAAS